MNRVNEPDRHQKQCCSHLSVVAREGDEGALDFDSAFDRFAPYVGAVALRLLGNESDVDDIVQEVFWDCYRKIDRIRDVEHLRRWLIIVTVRKTRRLLRKRKLYRVINISLSHLPDPPMPSVNADERATLIQLFGILDHLPVNQRLAWSLRYLEGAALLEVADACGCSLATAKRRISAANNVIKGASNAG